MFNTKDVSENEVTLEVWNDLTKENALEFHHKLEELQSIRKDIIVDLAKINAINSACIGAMLLSRSKLSMVGKKIRIKGCSSHLYEIFEQIMLNKLIDIER